METPEPVAPLDYPPPPSGATPGRRWTVAAFVLAGIALLVPIIGGPAGAAAGILGLRRGDPMGKTAVLVSVGATVVGLLLGALVAVDQVAAGLPPPAWYKDPGGRHELRYWDGERWTDGVASGGVVSEEPLPPEGAAAAWAALADTRHAWSGWVALVALGAALLCVIAQGVLYVVGDALSGDILAFVLAEIGLYGGFFLTCWLVSRSRGTGSVRRDFALRYGRGDWYRGLATSFLARLAAVVVSVVLVLISEEFGGSNTEVFEDLDDEWTLIVLFAVSALVIAPFFEELFFRGLLQRALENVLPPGVAIGLQAAVFGLFHLGGAEGAGNVGVVAATAAAGVLFGVVARKYHRLGPGIAGHAWFNLLPVAVLLLDR